MAKDFRECQDRHDNQKRGSNRNDVIGKFQPLLRRVRGRRTRCLCLRFLQRCFELWNLQLRSRYCADSGERNRQWRNRLSGGRSDGHWIEARRDFGNGPAPSGIAPQGVPRHVEKWLGKCIGNDRIRLASRLQCTRPLRERFDQSHTERPHVRGRGQRRRGRFGSIVSIEFAG